MESENVSTTYYLVNPERVKRYDVFEAEVNAVKEECFRKISEIDVPEYLEDAKDDVLETLRNHTLLGLLDSTEYDKGIGTRTSDGFRWCYENGFRDVYCLMEFLQKHPEYEIQDEYRTPISLEMFRTVCESAK